MLIRALIILLLLTTPLGAQKNEGVGALAPANPGTPPPCYRDFEEALHVLCSDTTLWRKYQFVRRTTSEFIVRISAKQGHRAPPTGGGRRGEESDQAAIVELEREQTERRVTLGPLYTPHAQWARRLVERCSGAGQIPCLNTMLNERPAELQWLILRSR
jgi:hypothetical protein